MDPCTCFPCCHWMAGCLLNHDMPSISCSLLRPSLSSVCWSSGSCELNYCRSWLNCLSASEPVFLYHGMKCSQYRRFLDQGCGNSSVTWLHSCRSWHDRHGRYCLCILIRSMCCGRPRYSFLCCLFWLGGG